MRAVVFAFSGLLSGCVSNAVLPDTPVALIGTLKQPRVTGWYRDFCSTGRPVRDPLVTDTCLPVGELYRANLVHARAVDGSPILSHVRVAFSAHGLGRGYSKDTDVFVQSAPTDFREATGIAYLITDYGNLRESGVAS